MRAPQDSRAYHGVVLRTTRVLTCASLWLLATACSDDESKPADTGNADSAGDETGDDTGEPPPDSLPEPPETTPAECPNFDMAGMNGFSNTGDTTTSAGLRGGSCGGRGAPEHVYAWVAPEDGVYHFKLQADFDAVLYVLDGGCEADEIACSDDVGIFDKQPNLYLTLEAGQAVSVVVDGQGISSPAYGSYTLEVNAYEYEACPSEDLGSTVPVTRTYQSGPSYVDWYPGCGGNLPERVYAFTAPSDGAYVFETSADGLLSPGLRITDAVCEDGEVLFCRSGTHVLPLAQGQTVSISTNHTTAFTGEVTLSVSAYDCQPTDLGSVVPANASGTLAPAKAQISDNCGGGEETVFPWTAPADGEYRFSTAGSEADTVLNVYDGGGCVGELLFCNDDVSTNDSTSSFKLALSAGQTVSVVVDSIFEGLTGGFELSITEEN